MKLSSYRLHALYLHGSLGLLTTSFLLLVLGELRLSASTLPNLIVTGDFFLLIGHKGWILLFELFLGLALAQDQVIVVKEIAVAGVVGCEHVPADLMLLLTLLFH